MTSTNMEPKNITTKVSRSLDWIISILEEERIDYQISGGLAASFYGATRPINDIDIDIREESFPYLLAKIKEYVSFGPELYIDSEWMILLIGVIYKDQSIDITNADNVRIFDDNTSEWKSFKFDLNNVYHVKWRGKRIRLMKPETMIMYKQYLHGEKQRKDIEAIRQYLELPTA